jgi:hypothetical protein
MTPSGLTVKGVVQGAPMSAEIRIQLSESSIQLRPGERAGLDLTVQNMSEIVDRYHITVAGIDPTWATLSRSELSLFPQGQDQVKITVELPQGAAARAGRYEILVQVASEENPAERSTATVTLEIAAVPAFDLTLRPQRQSGTGQGTYRLQVTNQGNADLSLQFEAGDPEEGCHYVFAPPLLVVPAGEERPGQLQVRAKAAPPRGQAKTYAFSVTARPAETPELVRQVPGEWEHVSRGRRIWPIILAILAGILALAAVFILVLRPLLSGDSASPTETPATQVVPAAEPTTPAPVQSTGTGTAEPTAGTTGTPSPVPMADLRVSEMSFDRQIFLGGVEFQVEITVQNAGQAAADPFVVRLLLLDAGASCPGLGQVLIEDTMPAIGPGTTATLPGPVTIDDAGQHTLCVDLDATGLVPETDEDNNTAQRTISVVTILLPTLKPVPIGQPTLILKPVPIALPTPTP